MRLVVCWVVSCLILAVLVCGLTLAVLPAPVALASGGVSAHHALAAEPHTSTLLEMLRWLRWLSVHLHHNVRPASRLSAAGGLPLATLHRAVCLAGCPPIVRPFSLAP